MWPFKKKKSLGPDIVTVTNNKVAGEGSYGFYFDMKDGTGIKVIKADYSSIGVLMRSYEWASAETEFKTQALARKVLGDLVPDVYRLIPVNVMGRYTAGIVMEHVPGMTLSLKMEMDETVSTLDILFSRMISKGITKYDHHSGNVMVTPDGDLKIIDWGMGMDYEEKQNVA